MICPYCETENREELDRCYNCQKDLTMLRLIVNRAHHHYNLALEHAERGRNEEALLELQNSLELNYRNAGAHVLLGTVLARLQRFEEAREEWTKALALAPTLQKAHDYLAKSEIFKRVLPSLRFYQIVAGCLAVAALVLGIWLAMALRPDPAMPLLAQGLKNYQANQWGAALRSLAAVGDLKSRRPESRQLARMLEVIINEQVSMQRQEAAQAARRRDYAAAAEALNFLIARNLDEREMAEMRNSRQQLIESAKTEIQRAVDQYLESGIGYDRAMTTLDRADTAAQLGLVQINTAEMRAKVAEARKQFESLDIAEIQAEWRKEGNSDAALIRLYRLMEQAESTGEAKQFYAQILKRAQNDRNRHIRDLVENDKGQQAAAYLADSVEFLPEKLREDILAGVKPPTQVIKDVKADLYMDQMTSFARHKQWKAFLSKLGEAASLNMPQSARDDLETTATLARTELADVFIQQQAKRSAATQWDAFLKHLDEADSYTLTEAQKEDLETSATVAREKLAEAMQAQEEKASSTKMDAATSNTLAAMEMADRETTAGLA
ncbi:MAG: hypothetical protein NTW86_06535, partial [Candidatus Sumerlaeota bacterium]|nr:hypothetical protein [Candidatus Sumerlaeota bacterium]